MKKIPVFLLKIVTILPLILFGAWLLKLVYFPEFDIKKAIAVSQPAKKENVFGKILEQEGPIPRGHFHGTDEYISQTESKPPLCLTCHGTYPHSKGEKVRSILNFHTGFIACSVCHSRKDPAEGAFSFAWVERESGMITSQIEGQYGKYPAKIFPITKTQGGKKILFRPVDEKSAQQYLEFKEQYTPDQIAQAKILLHDHIAKQPVSCSDCHQKDGYLNFAELGFPELRIHHLNSSEVVGMVEKYKQFYIPAQIDFGVEK